jgi:hypothetical protein
MLFVQASSDGANMAWDLDASYHRAMLMLDNSRVPGRLGLTSVTVRYSYAFLDHRRREGYLQQSR